MSWATPVNNIFNLGFEAVPDTKHREVNVVRIASSFSSSLLIEQRAPLVNSYTPTFFGSNPQLEQLKKGYVDALGLIDLTLRDMKPTYAAFRRYFRDEGFNWVRCE